MCSCGTTWPDKVVFLCSYVPFNPKSAAILAWSFVFYASMAQQTVLVAVDGASHVAHSTGSAAAERHRRQSHTAAAAD